jgi:hypothetical protein
MFKTLCLRATANGQTIVRSTASRCHVRQVGTLAPAPAKSGIWDYEGTIGACLGGSEAWVASAGNRRRDLPPIPIENSRKSQIMAELPHLHPRAWPLPVYTSRRSTMVARAPLRREALAGLIEIYRPSHGAPHKKILAHPVKKINADGPVRSHADHVRKA